MAALITPVRPPVAARPLTAGWPASPTVVNRVSLNRHQQLFPAHGLGGVQPPRLVRLCAHLQSLPATAGAASISPASRGPHSPSATSGPGAPTVTSAAAAAAAAATETSGITAPTSFPAADTTAQLLAQKAPQLAPRLPPGEARYQAAGSRSQIGLDEPALPLQARLTERPIPGQARWQPPAGQPSRCFLPRPLTYSSSLADVDPDEVAHVWQRTLKVEREPRKVMKAMRHSYSIVVVMDESQRSLSGKRGRIIGVGRSVSDGSFVATICDVAVLPEYQQKGVGRRIVRKLIQDMQRRGPSGFAVFPPPLARRFFWMMGFRYERKYSLMAYQGQLMEPSADVDAADGDNTAAVSAAAAVPTVF